MLSPITGRACDDVRDSLGLAALMLGRPDLAPWGASEEVFWLAGRDAVDEAPSLRDVPDVTVLDTIGARAWLEMLDRLPATMLSPHTAEMS